MAKVNIDELRRQVVQAANEYSDKAKDNVAIAAEKAKANVAMVGEKTKLSAAVVSEKVNDIGTTIADAKFEHDRVSLAPFFPAMLDEAEFSMPTIIRVVEDDKRINNRACYGAIGFADSVRERGEVVKYMTCLKNTLAEFGINLVPEKVPGFYYVNPYKKNEYINIDSYFDIMKHARVAELKHIAQSLGAKHFKVEFLGEKKNVVSQAHNVNVKKKLIGKVGAKGDKTQKEYETIRIESELTFEGSDTPCTTKVEIL